MVKGNKKLEFFKLERKRPRRDMAEFYTNINGMNTALFITFTLLKIGSTH